MGRKKKTEEKTAAVHLVVTDEFQHNGRWMRPGTEITVEGVKGRCRFVRHVRNLNSDSEWIECFSMDKHFRAFRPERIKTVHHTVRTRENSNG